jgi:hypothetical protein
VVNATFGKLAEETWIFTPVVFKKWCFCCFNPVVYSVQLLIYGFIVTLAISSVWFLHVKMYTRYKSMWLSLSMTYDRCKYSGFFC